MSQEVLSVAVFDPEPGKEEECLAMVRDLSGLLAAKNLSRDLLYRESKESNRYVLVRYWTSDKARNDALEDPAALRCWARMAQLMTIVKVYEALEEVPLT
jgi:quinol monooxygenase YgiN